LPLAIVPQAFYEIAAPTSSGIDSIEIAGDDDSNKLNQGWQPCRVSLVYYRCGVCAEAGFSPAVA
jgi:hypothetical protein